MNNTRTSNPFLRSGTFNRYQYLTGTTDPSTLMTINGTIDKSILLLAILIFSGIGSAWVTLHTAALGAVVMGGGLIVGLICAIALAFKPNWAPGLAPLYAVAEGGVLGAISLMYEHYYPGIVTNAMVLTVSIMGIMLILYRLRILQASPMFLQMLSFSMFGILAVYGIDLLAGMFGHPLTFLNNGSSIGIGFSIFVCIIASLNFIRDFAFIEGGAQQGAPKYMEWYAGFSLLVTLVWLYLEVLRLLAQTQQRRN